MAPLGDETVDELKKMVQKLESRVQELEGKLFGGAAGTNPLSAMRMIIMGPPGAGVTSSSSGFELGAYRKLGKGTQAPSIRDKYCVCHLV